MKKFSLLLLCVALFFTSCSKKEETLVLDYKTSAPQLTIVNNTIVFKDGEQYKKTLEFIDMSTTEEIMKWQTSMNFYSAKRYYEMAKEEVCCPDENTDLVPLSVKYAGKLAVNQDEHSFSSIVPTPTTSWLTNEKGGFKVAQTLVLYQGDNIYSILDKDDAMLRSGIYDVNADKSKILDVHAYGMSKADGVHDRGACGRNAQNTAPQIAIPGPLSNGCGSNGCHRIKDAWHSIYDESIVVSVSSGGFSGQVPTIIFNRDLFSKQQRRNLSTWSVCDRTPWTFTANYSLTHNVPAVYAPPSNPLTNSIGWTTGDECEWHYGSEVLFVSIVGGTSSAGWAAYYGRNLTGSLFFFTKADDGCGLTAYLDCQ